VELTDDRWEPHAVRRHMFIPTSQFHLYGHVTSRGPYAESADYGGDDNDDNEEEEDEKDAGDEHDSSPQLAVVCRAARDVRFYIVNVFLILVLLLVTFQSRCCKLTPDHLFLPVISS